MLKNYLKIALRNLQRHKGFAFIYVLGLAIGITCCLLIALYVQYETSYDRHHEKADRIFRVVLDDSTFMGVRASASTPLALAPHLQHDFPEVLHGVRFRKAGGVFQHDDQLFQEKRLYYADSTIFEVFSWPLLHGHPRNALTAPYSIVLTQEMARKYFGASNPVGKTLTKDGHTTFTVTGVLETLSPNTHLPFDGLLSYATLPLLSPNVERDWTAYLGYTFVLLPEGHNPRALEAKLPAFVAQRVGPHLQQGRVPYRLLLQPLPDIYLHSHRGSEAGPQGNVVNLFLFSLLALFILLIACANFVNLVTASAIERAKEVGVRKVVGAQRRQLVGQFLSEFVLLALLATVLAFVLADLVLPVFRTFTDRPLVGTIWARPIFSATLLGLALSVGVIAGGYPALVLSRAKPVAVLKGSGRTSRQSAGLRKGLVVFQFGISVVLIIGTLVIYEQLRYMRSQDLGFRQQQMLAVDFSWDDKVQQQADVIKQEFLRHPAIEAATMSNLTPGSGTTYSRLEVQNRDAVMQEVRLYNYVVDFDFLETYEIDIVAGRAVSRERPTDVGQALILNETAVTLLGYAAPEEAVGKSCSLWGTPCQVIGVVRDFHMESLRSRVHPAALFMYPNYTRYLSLQLNTNDMRSTLVDLKDRWLGLVPHRPFIYHFVDEKFNAQYQTEARFGQVFLIFAGLAVFVACLGLFGLVTFMTKQRTKEIGVHRVFGASIMHIVVVFSGEFVRLVGAAFMLAVPIAYMIMKQWLTGFAYRIDIGLGTLALAGGIVLVVTLVTISYQSIKAASANPIEALRYE